MTWEFIVYTSELGVNKCASSASVVAFEVDGGRGQMVRVRPAAGLCPLMPLDLCNYGADLQEVRSPSLL